jgi:uncharacterized protein YecE (DUF72 family)
MEFGRVDESTLSNINFSLQAEPAFNAQVLKGNASKNPAIYMGCAKWGIPEWVGKIYPPNTKEKDFLSHYIQHYNSIELNATHYKLYDTDTIKKWAAKAENKNFKFCPKMYNGITHNGKLTGKEFLSNEFLKNILEFKEFLGPIFIQVSEYFSPTRKEELFTYLKLLPQDVQFFMEVRHGNWFNNEVIKNELFETLKQLNIGAIITDAAGRRDCTHMHLSIPKAFIRYVGNSLHASDYARIDAWVERIHFWLQNGLQELYFFMHMHDEATSPELTAYLADKLNEVCGLQLQKPIFIPQQKGLFD